ncbi:MAG TPA: DUF1259 domain-containing protein [Pseudonocardiaceae bacterium]|jgi:hypothetical protein|nr:DUF1259 domain-containing protein [Pseudonocardiaceae bacterium]
MPDRTSTLRIVCARGVAFVLGALLASGCSAPPSPSAPARPAAQVDWTAVGHALGTDLKTEQGGVHTADFPRTDLAITNDNVRLMPGMELGSEAMFTPTSGTDALLIGEFTVTSQELNPVISRLQTGGIEISAVHKHLPNENPRLWWLHYTGYGDPVRNAATLRGALQLTGTPLLLAEPAPPASPPLDTAALDRIIRHPGAREDGAYQIHVPLNRPISDTTTGVTLPYLMEASTLLMFQPLDGGKVAINGDFAMTADQINPVISALHDHSIDIVSLHSHLTHEQPRLFYMHFWSVGDPAALAGGLRAALDAAHTD